MKQYSPAARRRSPSSRRVTRSIVATAVGVGALSLGACSSVATLTEERVARSETMVQQARQTIGGSEQGAVELRVAQDRLDAAKAALSAGEETTAERAAHQAQLHAELAIAQTQSAAARSSAAEVLASEETLRQEAERNSPTTR